MKWINKLGYLNKGDNLYILLLQDLGQLYPGFYIIRELFCHLLQVLLQSQIWSTIIYSITHILKYWTLLNLSHRESCLEEDKFSIHQTLSKLQKATQLVSFIAKTLTQSLLKTFISTIHFRKRMKTVLSLFSIFFLHSYYRTHLSYVSFCGIRWVGIQRTQNLHCLVVPWLSLQNFLKTGGGLLDKEKQRVWIRETILGSTWPYCHFLEYSLQ